MRIEKDILANEKMVIAGENYRFTLLTPSLIRMEYNKEGNFVDKKTQFVTNRNFKEFDYYIDDRENFLEIKTDSLHLKYNKEKFSKQSLEITMSGQYFAYTTVYRYGDEPREAFGTTKTLDAIDGEVKLENGIMSKFGWSIVDDSKTMILTEDNWVSPRTDEEAIDMYFFGYGRNYKQALKDYYKLSGSTPILPKFALGNWWSRYYRYTEESYLALMDKFEEQKVPLTVSVIDMDWHITNVDPKFGTGWTGYTWNKELFPNPKRFLNNLKDRGLRTTLNDHPADGVRAFEDQYKDFAEFMGIDPKSELPVSFDITNRKFLEGCLKFVHNKLGEDGVDFWWVDWQQGNTTNIKGLDPLWMLNHYHYENNGKLNINPLIFSRYAGPGSHRYPVGFSGDTITTWESLDFQPYFTATATNIGYTWWSHDIGGHMMGYRDEELSTRWTQFGVFSPIMRLHSSCNDFNGKEPWNYGIDYAESMKKYMRLRHRLIPYLHTMNRRTSVDGEALIEPMYYNHPYEEEAYHVPNQYYFGSDMIVCPITKKTNTKTHLASFKAWLPKGEWVDFFTGVRYFGDRKIDLHRGVDNIPVLVKAGGIIPMYTNEGSNDLSNAKEMTIKIFAGDKGTFDLYEDKENIWAKTNISYDGKNTIEITPPQENIDILPESREFTIEICGINNGLIAKLDSEVVNSKELNTEFITDTNTVIIKLPQIKTSEKITINIENIELSNNQKQKRIFDILYKITCDYSIKDSVMHIVRNLTDENTVFSLGELIALDLEFEMLKPIVEIIVSNFKK